jgi:glycogen phosphorylase/synthase
MAPLSTHEVPIDNEIIQTFMHENLLNKSDDRVKVILIPIYIQKGDNIFNDNYYDIIKGLDLGVFASYYEPWGYTPLESISFGVPTITSDLAGFGRAVEKEFGGNKPGVKVLRRLGLI